MVIIFASNIAYEYSQTKFTLSIYTTAVLLNRAQPCWKNKRFVKKQ